MNERQLYLWSGGRNDGLSAVDKSTPAVSVAVDGEQAPGQGADKVLVTVSVKQTGFYGCQSQFEVEVHRDSNLLKALDSDGVGGKEVAQHVLDWMSAAVQFTIVPLVSGVSEAGSSTPTHYAKR